MKVVNKLFILIFGGFILNQGFGVFAYNWVENSCANKVETGECQYLAVDDNNNPVPYCYTNDNSVARDCLLPVITNKFSQKSDSLNNAIKMYCDTMLSDSPLAGRIYFSSYIDTSSDTWDGRRTFDSQQSLFVYALCSSFLSGENHLFLPSSFNNKKGTIAEGFTGDIAKTLKLRQIRDGKDVCALNNGVLSNECDMSLYATEIFSAIMSEVFKIKYAQAVQVNSVKNFDKKEERIQNFLKGYFKFDDEYKVLKNKFPETIGVINSNQEFYKKVLKTIKLFDNEKIVEKLNSSDDFSCLTGWNVVGENFLVCALHGGAGNNSSVDSAFLTLYNNEILNYRIFVSYYKHFLQEQQKIGDENSREKWNTQLNDLDGRVNAQLQAAGQTLNDLNEVILTYPLHIGLLLYQEHLMSFRNGHLSPTITSFYSLSEKLQNVQIPD